MNVDASVTVEEVATIVLVGEADAEFAPTLVGLLGRIGRSSLNRLILDVGGLTHLSAAVLRCLAYAHQLLGRGVRVALIGATDEVAEQFRLAGLDQSFTIGGPAR